MEYLPKTIIFYLLSIIFFSGFGQAQQNIVPVDQTLVDISGQAANITGGFRKGENLYHDFQNFSLEKNDIANFLNNDPNAPVHTNIISRVTGAPSDIDGEIRTTNFESADLFFLNSKGISFGPNAKLNISGSFHASTGDYIEFENGEKYFADDSSGMSSLTSAPPTDFGFIDASSTNAARVHIEASSLSVPEGEVFRIVGGEIRVIDASLTASKGKIELVSKKESGIFSGVDTPGARVKIVADELSLSGQVSILHVGSGVNNVIEPAIDINVETLTLKKGAEISSATSSGVIPGDVAITAEKSINIEGSRTFTLFGSIKRDIPSRINTSTSSPNSVAGNITLITPDLTISDKGQIVATSAGLGNEGGGGNINLAVNQLKIDNNGKISSTASGDGKGGNIKIGQEFVGAGVVGEAELVSINGEGSAILSNAMGKGRGGNIDVEAKTIELLNGGSISAASVGFATGPSGDIKITAGDTLRLINKGKITLETRIADAGQITINAKSLVHLQNKSEIKTSVGLEDGNGGEISIGEEILPGEFRPTIVVLGGASEINTSAGGTGDGGAINIDSESFITSPDSRLDASSKLGNSGAINIRNPDDDVTSGLVKLSESLLNVPSLFDKPCAVYSGKKTSSFVVTGRQGLHRSPDDLLTANTVSSGLRVEQIISKRMRGKKVIFHGLNITQWESAGCNF